MRWMTGSKGPDERGAVAVLVALLMVALVGFAAMAVDVGRIASAKAQLQNGADASALAVAQLCAKSAVQCTQTSANGLADQYVPANTLDGSGIPQGAVDLTVPGRATVTAQHNGDLNLIFGGVLGKSSTEVTATATAAWGGPLTGPSSLPIAVAPCQITPDKGVVFDIYLKSDKNSDALNKSCPPDSTAHGPITGGFQWLVTDTTPPGTCTVTVSTDASGQAFVMSDPGVNVPKSCKDDFPKLIGTNVIVPVFSGVAGNGAGGKYYVVQWAAVKLLGYRFNGGIAGGDQPPGGSSTRGIRVEFVSFVADPTKYSGGGLAEDGVALPPTLIK